MYEDIEEIAENTAYLKVLEAKTVSLDMLDKFPPYNKLGSLEEELKQSGRLSFDHVFSEPTGFYLLKCFLIADYAVDKAIFIKDVEAYKSMRFESARRKIASELYDRFVSLERSLDDRKYEPGSSVFDIVKERRSNPERKGESGEHKRTIEEEREEEKEENSVDAAEREATEERNLLEFETKKLQMGQYSNSIGVYGACVEAVRLTLEEKKAPADLFDEVAQHVINDLRLDSFPRFLKSDFYKRYIQTKWMERQPVHVSDFTRFRALGRGGFATVHPCRKNDSGTIYAMKCINKCLVKVKSAVDNVLEERNVLAMMSSPFVTTLKYALQDEENLYLIMDLMLGGDLKFHLINCRQFRPDRARFYAAQVLLGLDHIHSQSIIYRDMKLENVLLDHSGNCRLSDLGLAVVTKVKIKGYAGTPGYTAPEMIRSRLYGPGADIFSFGVMLYRMLCGWKPFKGKMDRDLDRAVIERKPQFPKDVFDKDAISLLTGLLQKRPDDRLGVGKDGMEEIKQQPFFKTIDWGLLEAGYLQPPFTPPKYAVNAAPLKDIGNFDSGKLKMVKLDERFKKRVAGFPYVSIRALQEEMVAVMAKSDEDKNFEKFSTPTPQRPVEVTGKQGCCSIL